MDLEQVERLLKRYDKGETTLAEENRLHQFFQQEEVPEGLKAEQVKFNFFSLAKQETSGKDYGASLTANKVSQPAGRVLSINRYYAVLSGLAASLLMVIGLHIYSSQQNQLSNENKQLAYLETKKALLFISQKLNKGTEDLNKLSKLYEGQELITNK